MPRYASMGRYKKFELSVFFLRFVNFFGIRAKRMGLCGLQPESLP